jgi:hypothetical protein
MLYPLACKPYGLEAEQEDESKRLQSLAPLNPRILFSNYFGEEPNFITSKRSMYDRE